MPKALTHRECLKLVCFLCLKRCKGDRTITESHKDFISHGIYSEYLRLLFVHLTDVRNNLELPLDKHLREAGHQHFISIPRDTSGI